MLSLVPEDHFNGFSLKKNISRNTFNFSLIIYYFVTQLTDIILIVGNGKLILRCLLITTDIVEILSVDQMSIFTFRIPTLF